MNIYTISAIDSNDDFAYFSNYGNPPVDYAAPGVSIESTWKNGGYNTISGTSMAAPHVAGLLLLGNIRSGGEANRRPRRKSRPHRSQLTFSPRRDGTNGQRPVSTTPTGLFFAFSRKVSST